MSPQNIRLLLGTDADGMSDADILQIYDELYRFWRTFIINEK